MKKVLTLALSLVFVVGMSTSVFAADASTIVTCNNPAPPSYTVTIPSTIALTVDNGTVINPKKVMADPAVRGRELCSFTGNDAISEQSQALQFLVYDPSDLAKPAYQGKSFSSQLTFDISLVVI